MKSIKSTFILAFSLLLVTTAVLSQTASLLPNAVQQFFDNNGNPLSAGTVTTYIPSTSTLKTTWRDAAETIPNTNPIVLDGGGKAIIYGSGPYRQVVKDRLGNLIWDAVTAPGGSGTTPTLVGDGNLVGTVLPWSGIVAPAQYVFAYGQQLNRSAYPDYLTAITQTSTVVCSSGSNVLSGIADTGSIKINGAVEASCIPAGTNVVVSKTSSTVTVNNPANVSINVTATFFPYGNGNGTTTFNVPDLRGVTLVGRPNMGGTDAGNFTGCGTASLYERCGNQNQTLSLANLPAAVISPTFTGTAVTLTQTITPTASTATLADGNIPYNVTTHNMAFGADASGLLGSNVRVTENVNITMNAFNVSIPYTPAGTITPFNLGSGTSFFTVQPTATLNYIVKVTADVSSSSVSGVASINGMQGVLTCGAGLSCTGNVISNTVSAPVSATAPIILASGVISCPTCLTSVGTTRVSITIPIFLTVQIGGGCSSIVTPFCTFQQASDYIANTLDLQCTAAPCVTVQVANGVYVDPLSVTSQYVGNAGPSAVLFVASTSSSSTGVQIIPAGGGVAISASGGAKFSIRAMHLESSLQHALEVQDAGSKVIMGFLDFGPTPGGSHIYAASYGSIIITEAYSIAGSADSHYRMSIFGYIDYEGPNPATGCPGTGCVQISGLRAFPSGFANISFTSFLDHKRITFDTPGGTPVGRRMVLNPFSYLHSQGACNPALPGTFTYFPGTLNPDINPLGSCD